MNSKDAQKILDIAKAVIQAEGERFLLADADPMAVQSSLESVFFTQITEDTPRIVRDFILDSRQEPKFAHRSENGTMVNGAEFSVAHHADGTAQLSYLKPKERTTGRMVKICGTGGKGVDAKGN